jgi:DNA helicase II / ATP-dependent DNA helicase PcrA
MRVETWAWRVQLPFHFFMARQYTLHRQPTTAAPPIDFAAELNEQQCAAVTAPPGPALVIAGAGSGKTRTLTYRVAYLLENGILPENILLLTFTNKAAREMLDRVANIVPHDLGRLWGGTFHSVGNRMLRRNPQEAGFAPGFSIMDREDQQDLLDAVAAQLGAGSKVKLFPKGEVLADVFSYSLNTGKGIEDVLCEKHPHFLEFTAQIADGQKRYEERKKTANAVDFDDLLEKTLRMLQNHPPLAERYQRQFQFVLVDEYQDTNHLQADFIDILAARSRNVMVVGDDAQAIYSWRGANFQNILAFPKRYPEAKVYKIETNYRSTPEILEVANAAIAGNAHQFRKELVAVRRSGMKPALVALGDSRQQALFVAQRILELSDEGVDLGEIAILYRAHYHSMEVQMDLTRHGIPFQITSGLRFFEQAHVKDVASFLKYVVNPRDEVAFKRMVRLLPGIGARSAEALWDEAIRGLGAAPAPLPAEAEAAAPSPAAGPHFGELLLPMKVPAKSRKAWEQLAHTLAEIAPNGAPLAPAEMIGSVVEAVYDDYAKSKFPNYDQRREDLNTLANFARDYESAADFLDQLALLTSLDSETVAPAEDTEKVTLSSIHQAKGLEWKAVFVIWLSDGMFPSSRSLDNESALEEERRLFYVAVTRAKDELYLTYPHLRLNAGYGEMLQHPSRFLGEIPKPLLEEWQVSGGM